ncbi:MAG: 4Fe-4S binding protein [Emergencia sp.]
MKKVTSVCFSPTRSSARYAAEIARTLSAEYEEVDLTRRANRQREYSFGPEDLVVFSAPVYAGRLPLLETPLFSNIRGDGTPAVFCVVYGNREFEDALLEMQEQCEAAGFRGAAAAAWIAEHTYSDKIAGGRPDTEDLQQARDFAQKVKMILERDMPCPRLTVPGDHPYREAKHMPMLTAATEKCTRCGACSRICPAGAISSMDFSQVDETKCIGCLACLKRCMFHARQVAGPDLEDVRARLEPALAGIRKENRFFFPGETV